MGGLSLSPISCPETSDNGIVLLRPIRQELKNLSFRALVAAIPDKAAVDAGGIQQALRCSLLRSGEKRSGGRDITPLALVIFVQHPGQHGPLLRGCCCAVK